MDIPAEMSDDAETWRHELIDVLSSVDDNILEKYVGEEEITADDLVAALDPLECTVTGAFAVRGGETRGDAFLPDPPHEADRLDADSKIVFGLRQVLKFELVLVVVHGVENLTTLETVTVVGAISYDAVTRLPDAPDYIKGVINLRGIIVPVVDMRLKFRLAKAEYNALTVMIVLNVGGRVVGMVVDSVSDVVRLSGDQVRAVPEIGATIDRQFLTGIGTLDERMLILMDIEKLMSAADMALMDGQAQSLH